MLDIFYIEGVYCMDGQCDTYTGEVSFSDIMSGNFNLNSHSGKKATINLDMLTFNIDIAIDDQNGEIIKKELRDLEVITKGDGSWWINKNVDDDEFEITIKQS